MSNLDDAQAPDWREQHKIDQAKRQAIMDRLGLSIVSTFVPFSQSRNKAEKSPSLNYRVTLRRAAPPPNAPAFSEILTTDYSMGSGHCPAYSAPVKELGSHGSITREATIRWECEHGKRGWATDSMGVVMARHGARTAPILPQPLDVMHSLMSDADVIDASTFEDWASNYGYDTDSRKAEAMYRQCLELALKMRNGIGEAGLAELAEAFRDY